MLLVEYLQNKKEELEKSIHPTYNTALKNYIKLKIETLDWFLDLLEKTTKTSQKNEDVNRVLRILIKNEIQHYEVKKNSKDILMSKMVQYNDRIKCLESLLIILSNYEENDNSLNPEELISIFD